MISISVVCCFLASFYCGLRAVFVCLTSKSIVLFVCFVCLALFSVALVVWRCLTLFCLFHVVCRCFVGFLCLFKPSATASVVSCCSFVSFVCLALCSVVWIPTACVVLFVTTHTHCMRSNFVTTRDHSRLQHNRDVISPQSETNEHRKAGHVSDYRHLRLNRSMRRQPQRLNRLTDGAYWSSPRTTQPSLK